MCVSLSACWACHPQSSLCRSTWRCLCSCPRTSLSTGPLRHSPLLGTPVSGSSSRTPSIRPRTEDAAGKTWGRKPSRWPLPTTEGCPWPKWKSSPSSAIPSISLWASRRCSALLCPWPLRWTNWCWTSRNLPQTTCASARAWRRTTSAWSIACWRRRPLREPSKSRMCPSRSLSSCGWLSTTGRATRMWTAST